jgi:hypothetical protein
MRCMTGLARCLPAMALCVAAPVIVYTQAATPAPAPPPAGPAWTATVSLSQFFFPNETDLFQPTLEVDRGALHLEARYNDEDTRSSSAFVGWNLSLGTKVTLEVTPLIGFVTGRTDGGIAGAKLDLTWRRLEAYSEGEFVRATRRENTFFYSWSEFSVWVTEWLRGGFATQRTRAFRGFRRELAIERGGLVGVSGSRLEGTFYFFNPGSESRYFVASLSVSF